MKILGTGNKGYRVSIEEVDVGTTLTVVDFLGKESTDVYVDRIIDLWTKQFGEDSIVPNGEEINLTENGVELYTITVEIIDDLGELKLDEKCPLFKLINVMLIESGEMDKMQGFALEPEMKFSLDKENEQVNITTLAGKTITLEKDSLDTMIQCLQGIRKNLI